MGRVLVLGKYYEPFAGGIEANTASIARRLARRHAVTALVNAHDGQTGSEVRDGVEVIRRPVDLHLKSQPISLSLFRGVKLSDYDVVHLHAPNPFVAVQLWLRLSMRRRRPAVVITHHMEIYGRRLLRLLTLWPYRWLASNAAAVIVTSRKNAAISRDLPRGIETVAVPLGIDVSHYPVTDQLKAEALDWRRGLVGDAPAIGFVGRHARYKGLDVLMHALTRLPGVHALIAGDGAARGPTEALAGELGLSDRVHFLGSVDEATKLQLLRAIDVFAFPSTEITEAFGVSQMEAMLCSAPVVATDLPTGVTDVAIDGETALLAQPGSAESLATQIHRLLTDPGLAARLAAGGRQHILTHMGEDVVAERASEVIEAAMTLRPRLAPTNTPRAAEVED